jgi:cysteine desulfurase
MIKIDHKISNIKLYLFNRYTDCLRIFKLHYLLNIGILPMGKQVIFTSGGTEANNLALKACLLKAKTLTSAFEHASVLQSLDNPELVGITKRGYIDQKSIIQFAQKFDLASFMLVNNETGVIQDITSLSAIMKQQGAIVHTDAVQAAGKIPGS